MYLFKETRLIVSVFKPRPQVQSGLVHINPDINVSGRGSLEDSGGGWGSQGGLRGAVSDTSPLFQV